MDDPLSTRKSIKDKTVFWNKRRVKVISSMPCRELLQALEDGKRRTAKDLSRMTGRTPGALHSPLQRLCQEGIVSKEPHEQIHQGRGRPAQVFYLKPKAAQGLPEATDQCTPTTQSGNEAALRMLNRKVKKASVENTTLIKEGRDPLLNLSSIEYGFLTEVEAQRIEKKFLEIKRMMTKKRLDSTGNKKRFRIGMVLVQEMTTD